MDTFYGLWMIYLLLPYVSSRSKCNPIYVRWQRVKIMFGARIEGPYSLHTCKGACANDEDPVKSDDVVQCSGWCKYRFNHRHGLPQYSQHCQLYQADQLQQGESFFEADDRYSFYWEYCVRSNKSCSGDYAFTYLSDRYMDSREVREVMQTKTLEDCLSECLDASGYACRSVSYNRTDGQCFLSHHNQLSKPALIKVNNNPNYRIDYYENSCTNNSFTFDYECKDDGIEVKVISKYPYTGAMYGLYDFFTCRIEPKDETKFEYFFPSPTISKNCSDSIRYKGKDMVLEIVISTDGVEPLYFITPDDLTYQARCPLDGMQSLGQNTEDLSSIQSVVKDNVKMIASAHALFSILANATKHRQLSRIRQNASYIQTKHVLHNGKTQNVVGNTLHSVENTTDIDASTITMMASIVKKTIPTIMITIATPTTTAAADSTSITDTIISTTVTTAGKSAIQSATNADTFGTYRTTTDTSATYSTDNPETYSTTDTPEAYSTTDTLETYSTTDTPETYSTTDTLETYSTTDTSAIYSTTSGISATYSITTDVPSIYSTTTVASTTTTNTATSTTITEVVQSKSDNTNENNQNTDITINHSISSTDPKTEINSSAMNKSLQKTIMNRESTEKLSEALDLTSTGRNIIIVPTVPAVQTINTKTLPDTEILDEQITTTAMQEENTYSDVTLNGAERTNSLIPGSRIASTIFTDSSGGGGSSSSSSSTSNIMITTTNTTAIEALLFLTASSDTIHRPLYSTIVTSTKVNGPTETSKIVPSTLSTVELTLPTAFLDDKQNSGNTETFSPSSPSSLSLSAPSPSSSSPTPLLPSTSSSSIEANGITLDHTTESTKTTTDTILSTSTVTTTRLTINTPIEKTETTTTPGGTIVDDHSTIAKLQAPLPTIISKEYNNDTSIRSEVEISSKSSTTISYSVNETLPHVNGTRQTSRDAIVFNIFHNEQPVEAVVVGSKITLSFIPYYPISSMYMNIKGCQVEPIGSLYDWEREPLTIIKDGCQADHVGLVCPPQKAENGIKIVAESFRYQTTSKVQYSCVVTVCPFAACPMETCEDVEGCGKSNVLSNSFGLLVKRHITIEDIRAALAANPDLQRQIQLINRFDTQSQTTPEMQQQLIELGGDHVVKKQLVVVNSEEKLKYYVRTGDILD